MQTAAVEQLAMVPHTPGPWRSVGLSWVCSDAGIVATVVAHPDSQMKWATKAADLQTEANRRLVAAAPSMLEMLVALEKKTRHRAAALRYQGDQSANAELQLANEILGIVESARYYAGS